MIADIGVEGVREAGGDASDACEHSYSHSTARTLSRLMSAPGQLTHYQGSDAGTTSGLAHADNNTCNMAK
eukprot:COSAG01_NODE_340_length_18638_cov_56.516505_26_plen_70_part_00